MPTFSYNIECPIFYFKDNFLFPITKYCDICRCLRFDQIAINDLSSANLSWFIFITKYNTCYKINDKCCNKSECISKSKGNIMYDLYSTFKEKDIIIPSKTNQLDEKKTIDKKEKVLSYTDIFGDFPELILDGDEYNINFDMGDIESL